MSLALVAGTFAVPPRGAAGIQPTQDEARAICLTEVSGGSPIDETIRVAQGRARKEPAKPEDVVRVGRG